MQISQKKRDRHSIFKDGRYPIFNKTSAKNALRLRGQGNLNKKQRLKLIEVAAEYIPDQACKALILDVRRGKV